MNREILFRGKRINSEGWVYGYYWIIDEHFTPTLSGINYIKSINNGVDYEIIPESLGQFTGLLDKNGKKIFKGDIIKQRYFPLFSNEKAVEYYKEGVVDYKNNCFGIIWKIDGLNILNKDLASYYHKEEREVYKHPSQGVNWFERTIDNNRVEIIGNIHDNEKLKQ